MAGPPARVLDRLGLRPGRITVLKNLPEQNASWLIEPTGRAAVVLRRYHDLATPADLAYEHAVLAHLDAAGWAVPVPLGELILDRGQWYCLTRYVPGAAVEPESAAQQRRRGRDLARLHLALRGLAGRIGQRPGWRPQHRGVTVHTGLDWAACLPALAAVSPRLSAWVGAAARDATRALAAVGAQDLPLIVVHGDFAEWNVHYHRGRLAGVVDFGLAHLDSRPYDLAIARTYRAPAALAAYRAEAARLGWPLSDLEEAALGPVYRAFRVDMAVWAMDYGRRTGHFDLAMIERQLARTGTGPP